MKNLRRWFGGEPRRQLHEAHFEGILGTSLEIQLSVDRPGAGKAAEHAILAEIERLDAIFSTYRESSEVLAWLRTRGVEVEISEDFATVLRRAAEIRALTRGAFEPAVAALRPRSTSSPRRRLRSTPLTPGEVMALPELWILSAPTGGRSTAIKVIEGAVDLDGIAKGYIAERACLVGIAVVGVRDCLVNLGGDLRHAGENPIAVGITDPRTGAENSPTIASIQIRNQAVATSGGYRRGEVEGGVRRSHIIDPSTGESAGRIVSASVVAPSATDADALATAFSVLSVEESVAIADTIDGVGCLLVDAGGSVYRNRRWSALDRGGR